MPWTNMHWVVFALLCLLALAIVVIVRLLDRGHTHGHVPTRAQRRAWKRERLVLPRAVVNRRRLP